jgi:hypothetical protein
MSPGLAIPLAFILPAVMLILLAGPIYAGAYTGLVLLYGEEVNETAMHVDYQLATYQGLWRYWMTQSDVSWLDFVLPAFGPLALGVVGGIAFFWMFVRYLKSVFSI